MITLHEIQQLAVALLLAQRSVEGIEDELKQAKERVRMLAEESIPSAMQEIGLTEFKLDTGEKVTVKADVYASIPAARKTEAFEWLDAHGFGSLIKTGVSVQFGRGEMDNASELYDDLMLKGMTPELKQDVNAQTLKAWLREQLEEGLPDLPLDLFGARPVDIAKITAPKK